MESIKELDCSSIKDLGKLISFLKKKYPGQLDMQEVAEKAKKSSMIKPSSSINHFLNEVNNKIRLSDFIGQFVNLIEKGNSHVGKCPFHNEKTPSFNVIMINHYFIVLDVKLEETY